jgi:uncharacterized membrane protein (UPF0127 family)
MILTNQTRHTTVSTDCQIANSFMDRLLGLLRPTSPQSLIFFTRWGIHTFFMTKSIDILVLDQKWAVVKVTHSFPANQFYFYPPQYRIIIELPDGALARSRTVLGDKILAA